MPTVQEALESHIVVLKQHLVLWQLVEAEHGSDDKVKLIVSQAYANTMAMVTTCGNLEFDLAKSSKSKRSKTRAKRQSPEAEPTPTPSTKRRKVDNDDSSAQTAPSTAPVVDASGLFMIDPNPTNVDALLNGTPKSEATQPSRRKRRRPEQEDEDATEEEPTASKPTRKDWRKKRARKRAEVHAASRASDNPAGNEGADREEGEVVKDEQALHQAFEAKVAVRLKEKEEQRQKKTEKKRKRSSGASMANEIEDDADAAVEEPSVRIKRPQAKKARGNQIANGHK